MPLEISLALEEYQQRMHDNLEDLPGVEVIAYDNWFMAVESLKLSTLIIMQQS